MRLILFVLISWAQTWSGERPSSENVKSVRNHYEMFSMMAGAVLSSGSKCPLYTTVLALLKDECLPLPDAQCLENH